MATKLYQVEHLRRRFFGLKVDRPRAEPGEVLVLTGGGAPIVLWPGQKTTPGEATWNGYDTVHRIDTSKREFSMHESVPAKGGDVFFSVDLSASYRVRDPVLVINENITDGTPILRRVLLETISRVTENFDIEDVQPATKAVRELLDKGKFTEKLPFVLSAVTVRLQLDTQAKEFLRTRRQQRQDALLAADRRQLIEAEGETGMLQQQYDIKLEQERRRFEHELDRQRVEMELQIQRMRLDEVYKPMIEGGLWSALAQQLAQNPGDINKVSDMITTMHERKIDTDIAVLRTLIDKDMLEDYQAVTVVEQLVRNLAQGGTPADRALPDAGPGQFDAEDASAEEDDV
ncbi:MAG: hypothetical protein R2854_30575 [Caldilineaceae bacterium]